MVVCHSIGRSNRNRLAQPSSDGRRSGDLAASGRILQLQKIKRLSEGRSQKHHRRLAHHGCETSRKNGARPTRYRQDGDAGLPNFCIGMPPAPNFGFGSNQRCSSRGLQKDDELLHGGIRDRKESAGDVFCFLF